MVSVYASVGGALNYNIVQGGTATGFWKARIAALDREHRNNTVLRLI